MTQEEMAAALQPVLYSTIHKQKIYIDKLKGFDEEKAQRIRDLEREVERLREFIRTIEDEGQADRADAERFREYFGRGGEFELEPYRRYVDALIADRAKEGE